MAKELLPARRTMIPFAGGRVVTDGEGAGSVLHIFFWRPASLLFLLAPAAIVLRPLNRLMRGLKEIIPTLATRTQLGTRRAPSTPGRWR